MVAATPVGGGGAKRAADGTCAPFNYHFRPLQQAGAGLRLTNVEHLRCGDDTPVYLEELERDAPPPGGAESAGMNDAATHLFPLLESVDSTPLK